MTNNLNLGNKKIVDLELPQSAFDAANKGYVDFEIGLNLNRYLKKNGTSCL